MITSAADNQEIKMIGRKKMDTRTPEEINSDKEKFVAQLKENELSAIKRAQAFQQKLKGVE